MKTLKRGDKGEEVKLLQSKLGITSDSIFGPVTEKAVIEFQKAHAKECGEADGIVGPKTWAALGFKNETTTNSKCVDPSVIYAPLKSCITKVPNRQIKYLVYHFTAGASSAPGRAISMKNSWEKTRRASADFGVDDRDIVQFNPDLKNYNCWHCGDKLNTFGGGGKYHGKATNRNSIGIEICSNIKKGADVSKPNHSGWYYTEESLENAIKLGKILMKKYGIPIENVIRHYDVSGKLCPGILGWNDGKIYTEKGEKTDKSNNSDVWKNFKNRLNNT